MSFPTSLLVNGPKQLILLGVTVDIPAGPHLLSSKPADAFAPLVVMVEGQPLQVAAPVAVTRGVVTGAPSFVVTPADIMVAPLAQHPAKLARLVYIAAAIQAPPKPGQLQ